ncbi:hypothetical protein G7067_10570 [Leucobacter insecticola]|uniref:TipAS antibiotic-recognition domain-containing protein n=1 Tax=Leucobacter insecticola TaxID=2714934 RepID=A0A6G8FK75_9MICO|nr:TipAS antibiotic-recognition domain-containing protein [Leucobacter insecticola]QIM16748.1 hypothetical protein G7067_10570 [Leucobacter insecticola]
MRVKGSLGAWNFQLARLRDEPGSSPGSAEAGVLIAEHRVAIGQHVSLSEENYRALAGLYLTDPFQRGILTSVDPRPPEWLAAAMLHARTAVR